MDARAAVSGPELDPARRAGDTVGVLAADALRLAADFLDSVESDDASARDELAGSARVCRTMAEAMVRAPLADSARALTPTDLGGRFFTRTEQAWSNAAVAAFLLADTARIMETLPAADGALKNRLLVDAHRLRRVEALTRLAPNAELGPRLDRLMPLLRAFDRPKEGESPFPPILLDGVTGDPEFWAAAQDAYRIMVGRELDDLPGQVQAVWSGRLAFAWLKQKGPAQPLTQAEADRIGHAVRHPRAAWARAPLVPGDWTELEPEPAATVLRLIGARFRLGQTRTPLPLAAFCDRVRTRPLRCYGGALLVETQGRTAGGVDGLATFLLTDDDIFAADGASAWIHELNEASGARLLEAEARLDYVRLFMNLVRNEDERFQPAESFEVLADRAVDPDALRALCAGRAAPIEPAGFDDEGRWLFRAVIAYGQGLFRTVLALSPDGMLEMTDDDILSENAPLRSERLAGLFVVLEPEEARP